MTRRQILEKAIRKAMDRGWNFKVGEQEYRFTLEFKVRECSNSYATFGASEVIFNQDFARYLWGEKDRVSKELRGWKKDIPDLELPKVNKGWQHHLQMMVISDDPIKYLGEHI